MKTSFTSAALIALTLGMISTAQADHKPGSSPERLAVALAQQSRAVLYEIQHHLPHYHQLQHQAYMIYRLSLSTQHDVLHRHNLHNTIRQVHQLEEMIDDLEDTLKHMRVGHHHHDDRHVIKTVKIAEDIAHDLHKQLERCDRHAQLPPPRPDYGHNHDGHRHGVTRPDYITFNKGNFGIALRIR